jgi:hypothetical protein
MSSPFADSIYAQPGLTHLVRQYGNPTLGESYLRSLAQPSAQAVAAEAASLADARDEINWRNAQGNIVKTLTPSTRRVELTSHSDAYVNFFDSTSIKRNYTG